MNIKEISANSLSYIGDAVYTLAVRQYFIINKYHATASDVIHLIRDIQKNVKK